jgi:nucleoside-diphosphate-sugar epimerase
MKKALSTRLRAREDLGLETKTSLGEGLKEVIDWHISRRSGKWAGLFRGP